MRCTRGLSTKPRKIRCKPLHPRMIPKSGVPVFGTRSCAENREAERRKAHCPTNVRVKNAAARCSSCGAPAFRRSHFAALATGSTRWLSSRTGFPAGCRETGVSPATPAKMPRLSTLRADRSLCRSTGDPKPPGCGLAKKQKIRARAPHPAFAVTACRPERRPAQSEVRYPVTEVGTPCQGKSDWLFSRRGVVRDFLDEGRLVHGLVLGAPLSSSGNIGVREVTAFEQQPRAVHLGAGVRQAVAEI